MEYIIGFAVLLSIWLIYKTKEQAFKERERKKEKERERENVRNREREQRQVGRKEKRETVETIVDNIFGSWDDVLAASSLKEMSKYADHVCVYGGSDENFARDQVKGLMDTNQYKNWNSTSLGNLAYMAYNGHPLYRHLYLQAMEKYLKFMGLNVRFNLRDCYCSENHSGFCGKCEVCNKSGHTRHYPGPVPYTGSWCDEHYAEILNKQ